jgi:hypothetical protein
MRVRLFSPSMEDITGFNTKYFNLGNMHEL